MYWVCTYAFSSFLSVLSFSISLSSPFLGGIASSTTYHIYVGHILHHICKVYILNSFPHTPFLYFTLTVHLISTISSKWTIHLSPCSWFRGHTVQLTCTERSPTQQHPQQYISHQALFKTYRARLSTNTTVEDCKPNRRQYLSKDAEVHGSLHIMYQFIYLSVCMSVCLSIYLSIHHPSLNRSISLI